MKDKLSAFERRLEILFLLNKCKETTAVELAYYFAVSKDTIFRDVDFLNRYAPIYTKRGMFGGILMKVVKIYCYTYQTMRKNSLKSCQQILMIRQNII